MAENERTPLLSESAQPPENSVPPADCIQTTGVGPDPLGDAATLPIGTDELPPPYTPTAQGGIPMINCKVCQAIISLEGKQHLYVVKCSVCNEATPIRAAPPRKKYVRCPCNLLLVCRSGATRILCPRETCRRVITLPAVGSDAVSIPVASRYTCAYCGQIFVLRMFRKLVRCPHCRRLSSAGENFARTRAHIFLLVGLLFIGLAIGITVGTYESARQHGGIYVAWIGGFLFGVVSLIRATYLYTIRTSYMFQPSINP